MARIQTPQHVQELQAEFKVREPFGLELLETIQPTYSLGRQKVASTGYPRECIGAVSAGAGGVGTNIECALRCPSDRGIVIILNRWSVTDLGGLFNAFMTDGVAMATVSSANVPTKAYADGRITLSGPDGQMDIANPLTAAPNGVLVGGYGNIAGEVTQVEANIILGGGAYFILRNATANDAMAVNFVWTEFLLEDR